jgi:ribosomal protein L13
MTAIQLNVQNPQLWQNIGLIADSEQLMGRLAKYVAKLVKEKEDSTLISKEEFFSSIEKAEEEYRQGKYTTQLPGESVTDMLRRCGYEI